MEVTKGMVIGRKTVLRLYANGPYMWAITQCLCKHRTKRKQSVLSLVRGMSVSCSACFHDDLRAACDAVKAERRKQAEDIRTQFKQVKGKR